jgi:hypothetical protein
MNPLHEPLQPHEQLHKGISSGVTLETLQKLLPVGIHQERSHVRCQVQTFNIGHGVGYLLHTDRYDQPLLPIDMRHCWFGQHRRPEEAHLEPSIRMAGLRAATGNNQKNVGTAERLFELGRPLRSEFDIAV